MADQQTLDSPTPPQSVDPSHSHSSSSSPAPTLSRTFSSSRLNANAPEFVPGRPTPPLPQPRMMIPPPPPPLFLHMYHPPPTPFHIPITGHIPFPPHERRRDLKKKYQAETEASVSIDTKSGLPEDTVQKIVNQVEYYFSDLNLATTDLLMRFISKDPQGYVPMHIVASFNKIKSSINSNSQLATVLQNSSKLVVSEDGKRVRRLYPITESALEELQSRIVVAENPPEDHCYQNLMKIFSAVGSVKHIRTSQPQNSGSGPPSAARSAKTDFSNKVHAFVEYERVELAEKAVAELNEERNWSGLRVRLMLQHETKEPKHVLQERERKEEDDVMRTIEQGRGQNHYGRGNHHVSNNPMNNKTDQVSMGKQQGPRMPDGTRGFSLGRGKPVSVHARVNRSCPQKIWCKNGGISC
ncbi:unnamed protein product [Arabidopsis halleri]